MIAVRGLRVVFGRTMALDGIDADIEPGIVGLFGQNGAGKSTLLRVLAGLLEPTRGSATLGGVQAHPAPEELRRVIGYVGHGSGLYERLTLRENLELFARLYGVAPASVDRTLGSLGLTERADSRVGELSSGWARRAAVARAILHEPRFLFLDEPYANLDDAAVEKVTAAMIAWREPGRTAVIATHGAKRVKGFADAGIILQDGRIKTAGVYRRDPVEATT